MTMENKISVKKAIDILKSGGDISNNIISNLETSKIKAMDALLLAENGFVVPDGNIIYNDNAIKYDPDFDEIDWGKSTPFKHQKKQLEELSTTEELVVKLQIKNDEMKEWLSINRKKLDQIINKLLEDLYNTERMLKD